MRKINCIKGRIIVKKKSPYRRENTGKIEVVNQTFDFRAGTMIMAEVVDSKVDKYKVGEYVVLPQTGNSRVSGGIGPLEVAIPDGEEVQIGKDSIINDLSHHRTYWYISCKETEPLAIVKWVEENKCWVIEPVNKNYLVRCVNPMADERILQKVGLSHYRDVRGDKPSIILTPGKKTHHSAIVEGLTIQPGQIMAIASDVDEDTIKQYNKVMVNTVSAEFLAMDSCFDKNEWCVINKEKNKYEWICPAGLYAEEYQIDIRHTPFWTLLVKYEDLAAVES